MYAAKGLCSTFCPKPEALGSWCLAQPQTRNPKAQESKSLLLLGESSSGKTQAVDWCLQRLKEEWIWA